MQLLKRTPHPRTGEGVVAGMWPGVVLVALLVAAVLAPSVGLTSRLTNLRVELVLWALALPYLAVEWLIPAFRASRSEGRSHGRLVRLLNLTPIDIAFALIGVATLLSLLWAPLVLGEQATPRDTFELAKPALYWTAFRTALVIAADARVRRLALTCFLVAGALASLIALAQYFDWLGIVGRTGHWWAEPHHLRGLERDGRAFGTAGNPNYFGAMMAMVAVVGLCVVATRPRHRSLHHLIGLLAAVLGVLGVVLSGSRGALVVLLIAAALTLAIVPRTARGWAVALPSLLMAAAFLASAGAVELFPRGREGYLSRVGGVLNPLGDSALALRVERWRSALGIGAGGSELSGNVAPAGLSDTGRTPAGAAAQQRDAQRRDDLNRLVEAVRRYRDQSGDLPDGTSLAPLVPGAIAALPVDPLDGRPYRYERTIAGFTVAAELENPADPDYPLLATGEAVNYIENGSLERVSGDHATSFSALPGTEYRVGPEAALFGANGLIYRGNPDAPNQRAAVHQQRALSITGGAPLTAAVWLKFPRAVEGEVVLYTNIFYTDGTRSDPYAMIAADSDLTGVWQRLSLTVQPDPHRRIDFIGVYLLSDNFVGEVYADGFELVDGSIPVHFPGLQFAGRTAQSGLDAGAQIRRSPLFGGGPGKAEDTAPLDNEYLLVAARYGIAGLTAYLLLWGAAALAGVRAVRRGGVTAAALVGIVAGLIVFNAVAGSLYQMQLMAVFWPLAGVILAQPDPVSAAIEGGE